MPPVDRRPAAYCAGCFTAPTEDGIFANIYVAIEAGREVLVQSGFRPIIPHCAVAPDSTWDEAMAVCYGLIRSLRPGYDCLVMIDGWERSPGAVLERQFALDLGLTVYTQQQAALVAADCLGAA